MIIHWSCQDSVIQLLKIREQIIGHLNRRHFDWSWYQRPSLEMSKKLFCILNNWLLATTFHIANYTGSRPPPPISLEFSAGILIWNMESFYFKKNIHFPKIIIPVKHSWQSSVCSIVQTICSALHAFLITVRHIFSTGILAALHNLPFFFMKLTDHQDNIGLAFRGKSTAIPSPFWFIWYHQFSGRYFNASKSFFWYSLLPRCSDTSPFPHVRYRHISKSMLIYIGAAERLRKPLLIPNTNWRQAPSSLSSDILTGLS